MTKFYKLQCIDCKKEWDEKKTSTRCPDCHQAIDIIFDYPRLKKRLDIKKFNNYNFKDFYPFGGKTEYVSLNEGRTPLTELTELANELKFKHLFAKNEGANPTGVFKDRGSLIEITKARELKANGICCASTGNMAASVSAYAAHAGLTCFVFVPEGTPIGKLSQTLSYGAKIISIRGSYADCVEMCEKAAESQNYYLAGDYAFRGEGQKTIAFEIFLEMEDFPDYIVVPMGCGTNIAAVYKGFKEMKTLGLTNKIPRMVGVQPETVPTITESWRKKLSKATQVEKAKSVASAVGIGKPLDDMKALKALYESDGIAIDIAEQDILKAQYDLSRAESIFVEPSAALAIAALNSGQIDKKAKVVTVLTGTGLKDPQSVIKMMPSPHVLEPNIDEINKYFNLKLYEIKSSSRNKEDILWTDPPSRKELNRLIKAEFNIDLHSNYLDEVERQIQTFHEKIDKMRRADLEYIIQNVLKEYHGEEEVLKIKDFEVHINQHKKPLAWTQAEFYGEIYEAHAVGVGPVDAILKAVKNTIEKADKLSTKLTNYNVEINTGGTDAVVEVQLTLEDRFGTEVIGSSTSPDVIVASITAFEKAYNILHYKEKVKGKL